MNLFFLFVFTFSSLASSNWKNYPYQDPKSVIRFPEDEGRHTKLVVLEWWYTVIHARGESTGERYSILVTHFNNLFRFFNITNIDRKTHVSGTALGPLDSKIGSLDLRHKTQYGTDIYRSRKDETGNLVPFEYEMKTHHDRMGLDVTLKALKKPMMVAGDGYTSVGSSGHTWYYSLTRLEVVGTLEFEGHVEKITGEAWMDHQWGPFFISPVTIGKTFESYEWFCFQMDDGSEIMLSNIYDRSFNLPQTEAYGRVERIDAHGKNVSTLKRIFTRTGYWQDPVSGHYMSMGWRLQVPEWDLDLTMTPDFYEQMVRFPFNGDFWEGSIKVEGTIAGKEVKGKSYGELIHRFNRPVIKIHKLKTLQDNRFLEVSWDLKNPDAGNPLSYQVILKDQQEVKVLGRNLKERTFIFPRPKNKNFEIKVIGHSVDGTISGEESITR